MSRVAAGPARLDGKVAVVTGGGTGIGRASSLRLAGEGATVVVAGDGADDVQAVVAEIEGIGGTALAVALDVTDSAKVQQMATTVEETFGRIDILVTSAGVMGARSLITETTDEAWRHTIEVNLNAGFYCLKAMLPGMLERNSGRIIMISSSSGKLPAAKNADYAASKHGVLGLMKALALELGILRKDGVTSNAICPGSVRTPMIDAIVQPMAARAGQEAEHFIEAHVASKNLQRRLLEADEIAAMVAFLASGEARGITGQAMSVCAGTVLA